MSVPDGDPQQLIKKIGRALLGAAPPDWRQIRAEYRSAGRHIEADVTVTGDDDQQHPIRPPLDVVELLGELRALMYRPGRGTWLSGLYVLDHPSKYSAEFEPDVEPRWRRVPPPIGFQDELRRFPREDAHIPAWLRARAGLPPITDATATPPGGIPAPTGGPANEPTGAPAGGPPPAGTQQPPGTPLGGNPLPHPAAPPSGPAAPQQQGQSGAPNQLTGHPGTPAGPPAHPAAPTAAPQPGQPGAPHQPSGHPGSPSGTAGPAATPPGGFPPPQRHTPPGGLPLPNPSPGHTPPGGLPRPPGPRPSPEGAHNSPPGGTPAPQGH
jgi:hypothetical protein